MIDTTQPPSRRSGSGYYHKQSRKYYAQFRKKHLGMYTTAEAAAVAWNKAVMFFHPNGDHYLNDVPFTDAEFTHVSKDKHHTFRSLNNA